MGFNIKTITADTFQSTPVLQALQDEGFNTKILSVDRISKDHICEPYEFLKTALYEQRIIMFKTKLLKEELVGLKKDNTNGKVDHGPWGINSKDSADAFCGSVFEASKHGEEFAFNYGEVVDQIINTNNEADERMNSLQELSLNSLVQQELDRVEQQENNLFMDFGYGSAKPIYDNSYLLANEGILFI